MHEFDRNFIEEILITLDKNNKLFPQFSFEADEDGLKLLGSGGFSYVYEIYNREQTDFKYALKVIGFNRRLIGSKDFYNAEKLQWLLCQESDFVVRVYDTLEISLIFDENGSISEIREKPVEISESDDSCLNLQFVLLEKLEQLLYKDRFKNVSFKKCELHSETEVLKLALEVGSALNTAHTNNIIHRDVKLENIFWDSREQKYKLGDFGISKYTEDGKAETIVYTTGYGAPEIERSLNDSYDVRADIYSFGVTLYLLLNDLKFPASSGYFSKVEVQYNPDFVFPAPVHASVGFTKIIHKMCSYYPNDRYQSMADVLQDLIMFGDTEPDFNIEDFAGLADIETETYRDDDSSKAVVDDDDDIPMTREQRKKEQQLIDFVYLRSCAFYFVIITFLFVLFFEGLQQDVSMVTNNLFWLLPISVAFEAILQSIKAFDYIFGLLLIVFCVVSVFSVGVTIPHIVLLLAALNGCPMFTASVAVAVGIWSFLSYAEAFYLLDFIRKYDLSWIAATFILFFTNRYFNIRIFFDKTTYVRACLGILVYDGFLKLITISGALLFVVHRLDLVVVPDVLISLHLFLTGAVLLILKKLSAWYDFNLDDVDNFIGEKGAFFTDDNEYMDE